MNERLESSSNRTAAMFLCVLLAAFAVLHAYWALGGNWGYGIGSFALLITLLALHAVRRKRAARPSATPAG